MEYSYKNKKLLLFVTTWLALECIMPSEIREEGKHCMILVLCGV